MKNIDVKEIIAVMDELEKERGISKDYLVAALEEALVKAYKQNFDADENVENVKVTIDKVTGEMHVYSAREVVAEFPVPEHAFHECRGVPAGGFTPGMDAQSGRRQPGLADKRNGTGLLQSLRQ